MSAYPVKKAVYDSLSVNMFVKMLMVYESQYTYHNIHTLSNTVAENYFIHFTILRRITKRMLLKR